MRLIDANELLKWKTDHEVISTHLIYNAPTVPAIPIDRIKQLREETKQLQLVGYATVDGKRQIASRAVLELIDNMIKEYEQND